MNEAIKEKFDQNANSEEMAMYDSTMDMAEEMSGDRVESKPTRRKFKPETYQFISIDKGASFIKVLNEMRARSMEISDFFNSVENNYGEGEELKSIDDYFCGVAREMCYRCPRLLDKVNIHTTFNITANKLHVRLESNIAFGFNITYKVFNGVARPEFTVGTITLYEDNANLRDELVTNGWRLEEKRRFNR